MGSEEIAGSSDKGKGERMVFDWSLKRLNHFLDYRSLAFTWVVTGKILSEILVKIDDFLQTLK